MQTIRVSVKLGIAEFENGQVIKRWSTLVNPEAFFDPFNISIHGIDERKVKNAPTFDKLYNELKFKIQGRITVHHMPFDKIAIARACREYNLELIDALWLDSARIVRRTWEQFAYRGYGLANIAEHLKIEFAHHDALEDAITAGRIVVEACKFKMLTVEHWLEQIKKPISSESTNYSFNKLEVNANGPLHGELIVFTGALFLPRIEAAKIATDLGCKVENFVSKTTTMLVVGTQDSSKLAGYDKSTKHRKAEDLIKKGFPVKILSERDFVELCKRIDQA